MRLRCLLRGHDWDRPRLDAEAKVLRVRCAACGRPSPGVPMMRGPVVRWARPDARWAAHAPATLLPWRRRA